MARPDETARFFPPPLRVRTPPPPPPTASAPALRGWSGAAVQVVAIASIFSLAASDKVNGSAAAAMICAIAGVSIVYPGVRAGVRGASGSFASSMRPAINYFSRRPRASSGDGIGGRNGGDC